MENSKCFAELFHKATIFDGIYQNLSVSISESDNDKFIIEVASSYNVTKEFSDVSEAASFLSNFMKVKTDYLKLRIEVNRVCNLVRDYAPLAHETSKVKKNDRMLACLSNFADLLRHYEGLII